MTGNPYWLVSPLTFESALVLATPDCVEHFQRDPETNEAKFWPGSNEVFEALVNSMAPGLIISTGDGQFQLKKVARRSVSPRPIWDDKRLYRIEERPERNQETGRFESNAR